MKKQQQIIFDNACGCIVDLDLLSRALIWYADGYPLRTERMIYLQNGYPTVSKGGMQVPVHRLIAMYTQREKIASSMACHHLDGNMLNASADNLDVMPLGHHVSLHRAGTIRAFTEEHIEHMREAQQRRWKTRSSKNSLTLPEFCISITSEVRNMIKTFCDRCKTHIPITDEQNTLTLIGGGDIRINNYCSACYPKVLAELIPVLEGRNQ